MRLNPSASEAQTSLTRSHDQSCADAWLVANAAPVNPVDHWPDHTKRRELPAVVHHPNAIAKMSDLLHSARTPSTDGDSVRPEPGDRAE